MALVPHSVGTEGSEELEASEVSEGSEDSVGVALEGSVVVFRVYLELGSVDGGASEAESVDAL